MKEMNAAIVTIGDELLIGQTIDTNSAFIGQALNAIGVWLKRRVAVGDVREEIIGALQTQCRDCNIIIITGGLGPTADDITKPVLCDYFNTQLIVDEGALQNVKAIFQRSGRPLLERNLKQAEVPQSCTVLPNTRGTAPGMWFEKEGVFYVSLPGVPNEMKGLMQLSVIPMLQAQLTLPAVVHRTLLTSGVGESTIADKVEDFENSLPSYIKLAYLPAYATVRLRLTCRHEDKVVAEKEISQAFEQLKALVGDWMVSDTDVTLQEAVSALLKERKKTVSTAESCTGGYLAHLLTSKAGSSAIYKGSVVSYANEVKIDLLGVTKQTLDTVGAVSEETVRQMIAGVLQAADTDYAIATSGIMGPDGGSEEKPVGTVWIAVGNRQHTKAKKYNFRYDRERNIELTAQTALTMLYRFILDAD